MTILIKKAIKFIVILKQAAITALIMDKTMHSLNFELQVIKLRYLIIIADVITNFAYS